MTTMKRRVPVCFSVQQFHLLRFFVLGFFLCFGLGLSAQPIFSNFPPDLTVECDNVPVTPMPTAVGLGACMSVNVAFSEVTTAGNTCAQGKVIQRIYTATDNCGLVQIQTQTITVRDTKAPQIIFTAPLLIGKKNLDTLVVPCDMPMLFDASSAYATDACDDFVQTEFKDNLQLLGNCKKDGYIMLMNCSWIATDDCGNKTEVILYFKVVDTKPPWINNAPSDITIDCDNPLSYFSQNPTFKDNCDNNPFIATSVNVQNILFCQNSRIVIRGWTVTDACGNSVSATQKVTISDTKPPVISNMPKDVTILYGQPIPSIPKPIATDNCTGPISLTSTINKSAITCDSLLVYRFTAKDACGNTTVSEQKITILMPKPSLGVLQIDAVPCLPQNDSLKVTFKESTASIVPKNYSKIYVLADKTTGTILNLSVNPFFTIKKEGDYSIYILIYQKSFNPYNVLKISNITSASGCFLFNPNGSIFNVKACVPNCVLADLTKATTSDVNCGQQDGAIDLNVSVSNYNFKWNTGDTTFSLKNLTVGDYSVTITAKNNDTCKVVKIFTLKNIGKLVLDAPKLTAADCGNPFGSAAFSDTTLTYTWFDGQKIFSRKDLKPGIYEVTVTKNTCSDVVKFEVLATGQLSVTAPIKTLTSCTSANGSVVFSDTTLTYTWFDGKKTYQRNDLKAGTYQVTATKNACSTILDFEIFSDKKINIIPDSSLILKELECKDGVKLCIPINLVDYMNLNVSDNGQPFTGKITACKFDTLINYSYLIFPDTGKAGPYLLEFWNLDGKKIKSVFDNVNTLVDSMNVWNPTGNWKLNKAQFTIEGGDKKSQYGDMTVKQIKGGETATLQPNWNYIPKNTNLTLQKGKHILVFEDKSTKCKDSLYVNVLCDECPNVYTGATSIVADSCTAKTKICLNWSFLELKNTIIKNNGNIYTEKLENCNVNGAIFLPVGINVLNFKDSVSNCEKSYTITVTCKKDSVPTSTQAAFVIKKVCVPDVLDLCYDSTFVTKPYTLTDLCKNKNYKAISYKINDLCIKINAISEGKDTICLYFCNGNKKCDTTYLIVDVCKKIDVEPSKIDTIYKEVCLNKNISACVGKFSIGELESVTNYCAANNTGNAAILVTPKFNCIEVKGKKIGTETACIRLCNNQGKCDTVILVVNVKNCPDADLKLPVAKKDSVGTLLETAVLIFPLLNDTLNGQLVDFRIITTPKHGTAVINADKSVTYTPYFSFCDNNDEFEYFIENKAGRDSTKVCISVNCESFIIFNGFSPNGDGKNEVFTIQGIERYEDSEVDIFNRWGNSVFSRKPYRNEEGWDGTWNGEKLADGTYFYKIKLPRLNKTYIGYVEIRR